MGNTFFFEWEILIAQWLQSFESGFITALAKFFTLLGEEYLLILILGTMYWCISKELGKKVSLAMSGSMIAGALLKGIALRRRPYMDNPSVKCIRAAHPDDELMSPLVQGYSMPSLHAAMSGAVYGTIARNVKKKITTILAFMIPLFIGLSRVYLGVHYATDVLAGWLLGAACVFVFGSIEKRFGCRIGFAVVLLMGAAGFFYCRDTEFYSSYGVALGLFIGFALEEKFVNFEMPKKWWSYAARPVFGVVFFFAVNTGLKLPVANVALEETDQLMLVYRLIRYTAATTVTIGVYPMTFKLFNRK